MATSGAMSQSGKSSRVQKAFVPLSKSHPLLAAQWHPTKNGNVSPDEVWANYSKHFWWRCEKGHAWSQRIRSRAVEEYGCPFCSGRKTAFEDSLVVKRPDLAAEWHPTKNGTLKPDAVGPGSNKYAWWQCKLDSTHEWRAQIVSRGKMETGCPECAGRPPISKSNYATRYPHLMKEWHPTLNGSLDATKLIANSRELVWWQCPKDPSHVWQTQARSRIKRDRGCPKCRPKQAKLPVLTIFNPQLASEWHPTKNGDFKADQVTAGSTKEVWWQCSRVPTHEWEAAVRDRTMGNGCPLCAGQRVDASNSLATLRPDLAAQWHPTKNGERTPRDVTPGSSAMIWWQCNANPPHEWQARVLHRSRGRGTGCPTCAGKYEGDNNTLAARRPDIAAQWHKTKNGKLTPADVTPGSEQKAWWQCDKDPSHAWEAQIKNRVILNSGCPICRVGWTVAGIRSFVDSLQAHISAFTPAELYVLFQQNGLLAGDRKGQAFLDALATGRFPFDEIEKFCKGEKSLVDSFLSDSSLTLEALAEQQPGVAKEQELGVIGEAQEESAELPTAETEDVLKSLQAAVVVSADQEAVEFLVASALAKIWKHAFRDESAAVAQARAFTGDAYAERVRTEFLAEYERVKALEIPAGYSFKVEGRPALPNLMQRLVASRIQHKRREGNWSGTGAGKTLSAVLASRVVGAKLTVICCPNSVVEGWKAAILNAFPDSLVATKTFAPDWAAIAGDETGFGKATAAHRYVVLNYEAFQQEDSEKKVRKFAKQESADFVVVDEIHFTKQRTVENLSKRKKLVTAMISLAAAKNPRLCVLGMSATPVINNLQEGKSLVEMVSGLAHDDLNTRPTVAHCMKLHQRLVTLGTRWLPDYQIVCDVQTAEVDCGEAIEEIKALGRSGTPLELEQILTRVRLPIIRQNIRPKTLLYTHYIQDIDSALYKALVADGWRVGFFTGDDKSGLEGFLHGDVDVLIGSSAIGTGVDGLQEVCQRLVINVLPWTNAEFEQLKGRIFRQGQHADKVTVIVPITYADVNGQRWSWCGSKMRRLHFKKSIADAAVDGVVPEGHLRTSAQAYQDVMGWLDRLTTGRVEVIERARIVVPLPQDDGEEVERRARKYGDFSAMNGLWNRSRSATTQMRLRENPEEWAQYHTLYREARKDWSVVPFEEFIRWAKQRSDYVIGDFGCGEAKVAEALADRHTVHSFDYVAANDEIVACDMTKTPLEDGTLDVALFSLSLMGANFTDYLREAWRVLKLDGQLHIFEATSRFSDREAFVAGLKKLGFAIVEVRDAWKFTHIRALKTEHAPSADVELRF